MDNTFTERLWRSIKYEEVYINDYETVRDAKEGDQKVYQLLQPRETASVTGL